MRDTELDLTKTPADLSFDCPRCGAAVTERTYGPCQTCCGQLRAIITGTPDADAVVTEFEPKMNVTPNAVALKDD